MSRCCFFGLLIVCFFFWNPSPPLFLEARSYVRTSYFRVGFPPLQSTDPTLPFSFTTVFVLFFPLTPFPHKSFILPLWDGVKRSPLFDPDNDPPPLRSTYPSASLFTPQNFSHSRKNRGSVVSHLYTNLPSVSYCRDPLSCAYE